MIVLQAVHDTCVIHRDIKPANIFMCPDNVVKVSPWLHQQGDA